MNFTRRGLFATATGMFIGCLVLTVLHNRDSANASMTATLVLLGMGIACQKEVK